MTFVSICIFDGQYDMSDPSIYQLTDVSYWLSCSSIPEVLMIATSWWLTKTDLLRPSENLFIPSVDLLSMMAKNKPINCCIVGKSISTINTRFVSVEKCMRLRVTSPELINYSYYHLFRGSLWCYSIPTSLLEEKASSYKGPIVCALWCTSRSRCTINNITWGMPIFGGPKIFLIDVH